MSTRELETTKPKAASSVRLGKKDVQDITFQQPVTPTQKLLQLQRNYGNRNVQRVVDLARKDNDDTEVIPEIEKAIQRARGSGQHLDGNVREQMEPFFGNDFRSVRVHTGIEADVLNRAVSARAFTTGKDIFFKEGEYNPGSSNGRELIAHELTHVVQQANGLYPKTFISNPRDKSEQEADEIARLITQPTSVNVKRALGDTSNDYTIAARPEYFQYSLNRTPISNSRNSSVLHIQRYEGGEHLEVGDQAYAEALSTYITKRLEGVPEKDRLVMKKGLEAIFGKTLRRLSDQKEMSYGAVTALSGDFYATAKALYDDTEGWINNTDIDDLIKHFSSEREAMNEGNIGEEYETSEIKKWWNSKDYVDLATQNAPHFVGHTLSTYIRNHRLSLDKAQEAYKEKDETKRDRLWMEALFLNAFADHFLTDSFCSGHMRVPRMEITKFFNSLDFNEKEAGWMAKVIHDFDNTKGVAVRNSRGDHWVAFGDKLLRADLDPYKREAYKVKITQNGKTKETDKTGEDILREAVNLSVMEILTTYNTGHEPKEYAALKLMPFVDWGKQATRLEDIFNVSMASEFREKHVDKSGWKRHLAGTGSDEMDVLVRNLPRLMNEFHFEMRKHFEMSNKEGVKGEFAGVPEELRKGLLSLGAQRPPSSQVVKAVKEILIKESYLNDDEQKEIIALIKNDEAAAKQIPDTTRFECYSRFDAKNYDQLLIIFRKVYLSWNYEKQIAEIRVHLKGRTNEKAEKTIVTVLECISNVGWKSLLEDQRLIDWLDSDLTGVQHKRFKNMLKEQRTENKSE